MNKVVHLLLGDPFLRSIKLKDLLQDIRKNVQGECSVESFALSDTPLATVLTRARNLSFFAKFQILRIQEADRIKADDTKLLETYLAKPSSTSLLIFEADEMDRRSAYFKLIQKKGHLWSLNEGDLRGIGNRLIQEKMRHFKKKMMPQAQHRILEMCGENIMFLDTILDRLIVYSGDKPDITDEMVGLFEEDWKELNVYELTNSVLERNTQKALFILKELIEHHGQDLIALLGLLHWQLRQLWHARVLLDASLPERTIVERCRIPRGRSGVFLRNLRSFPQEKLEKAIKDLFQLDVNLKTGRREGTVDLERWLVELTS